MEEFTPTPAPAPAAAAEADPGKAPQFATVEQMQDIGNKLNSDLKAMLGRVPGMIAEQMQPAQPTPTTPTEQPKGEVDAHAEVTKLLKEEREKLAAEKQSVQRERIRGTLETALIENDISPDAVKLVTDSIMMRNAERISVNSNELGESNVQFRESEFADPVTMADFAKSFMLSPEGISVARVKTAPSLSGVPSSVGRIGGDTIKMTRAQASKADPAILKSGKVEFID